MLVVFRRMRSLEYPECNNLIRWLSSHQSLPCFIQLAILIFKLVLLKTQNRKKCSAGFVFAHFIENFTTSLQRSCLHHVCMLSVWLLLEKNSQRVPKMQRYKMAAVSTFVSASHSLIGDSCWPRCESFLHLRGMDKRRVNGL